MQLASAQQLKLPEVIRVLYQPLDELNSKFSIELCCVACVSFEIDTKQLCCLPVDGRSIASV